MAGKTKNSFDKVYEYVAKIPEGKVTTYGALAEACGGKISPRVVVFALHSPKNQNLPCHRVVNKSGELTGRNHFGDPMLMENLLRSEGVTFNARGFVNMDKHFWKPRK